MSVQIKSHRDDAKKSFISLVIQPEPPMEEGTMTAVVKPAGSSKWPDGK